MSQEAVSLEKWRPRAVEPLGLWQGGDRTLKAYGIRPDAKVPLPFQDIGAARALIGRTALSLEGRPNTPYGFAILHRGDEVAWLLLHWWLDGGICAQRLWRSSLEGPLSFVEQDRPLMACVWELAVIDHERRAWMRTAMNAKSSPDAYLRDWLPEGFC